ncbi:hypothetical protein IEO21_07108 [Rhodonia placenta]|uniref:Uncharacterized protein n=1 Tax=Rhodonia placenta TaxID=104341 RepID=A0A8H7NYR6_9APHY|nr:hypothetical protein IEO21_07108 [Postia placenta]
MYQWPLIHDLPTNEQHPESAGHPVASSSKSILQAEAPQSGAEIPQYRVVPQRLHKPDSLLPYTRPGFEGIGSVRFDRVNSTVGFGVGLTGLLDGSACLNDQDKCIFQGSGEAQLTFRILWPSYPHFDFGRIINLKYTEEGKTTVHHVTRLEIARIIAICFDEFVDVGLQFFCNSWLRR